MEASEDKGRTEGEVSRTQRLAQEKGRLVPWHEDSLVGMHVEACSGCGARREWRVPLTSGACAQALRLADQVGGRRVRTSLGGHLPPPALARCLVSQERFRAGEPERSQERLEQMGTRRSSPLG